MDTRKIRSFRSVLRQFERAIGLQLKSCCCQGVTLAQCHVLLEVEQHGRPTVGQLAARLRLDDSTLSRTIDGLVKQGLLKRVQDERDRRAVSARLTAAGSAACRSIHRENDECVRRVFERIPASERAAVARHFETLARAFMDHVTDSGG